MHKHYSYILVGCAAGCSKTGVDLAPNWMFDCGLYEKYIHEDFTICNAFRNDSIKLEQGNISIVREVCVKLRQIVEQQIKKGRVAIIIGGDHSIALGSVAGSLLRDANLGVVWFDAHGDINTERTSPTGNIHGMPVAALMGLCESAINEVATVRLQPQNMFWVGARDLDPGEKETIQRLGIADHVYSTEYIHRVGMKAVMQDIANKMQARGINHWHLSFDIDGMNPMLVPATGVPVPKGMTMADLEAFIQSMAIMPELSAMDFVEYNPLLDDKKYNTGEWCLDTINKLINGIDNN